MYVSRISRAFRPICQRSLNSAVAFELPTRHSIMQPPRVCSDPVELREETEKLLDTPVGKLYAGRATASGGRDEAYDLAYDTIKKAEYLQFGHASRIPGSMYEFEGADVQDGSEGLALMKPLVVRMQQEGQMYLQVRKQKQRAKSQGNPVFSGSGDSLSMDDGTNVPSSDEESDDNGSGTSSNTSDESSSSSDEDSEDESGMAAPPAFDFAPPGPTAKMQEALLDAMACVGGAAPREYYETALTILNVNDLEKGTNPYTLPSHVTYNAALRGISQCKLSDEAVRDEALSAAFVLYNHLTHSLHLPRNSATFVHMLQTVNNIFPASRVKGNICVTLWDHATQLGVADADVVETLKVVLGGGNGPEFQILIDELSRPIPQKYQRFANKYRHSEIY